MSEAGTQPSGDLTPDGFLYVAENGVPTWFCSHCIAADTVTGASLWDCYVRLSGHLRYQHGILQQYLSRDDPAYRHAVQAALPFAIALKTR